MLLRRALHLSFRCEYRAELSAEDEELTCASGDRIVTEFDRRDLSACYWSSLTRRHACTWSNCVRARVVRLA